MVDEFCRRTDRPFIWVDDNLEVRGSAERLERDYPGRGHYWRIDSGGISPADVRELRKTLTDTRD